ncbi:MAG: DUF5329 domain-containing protein [Desulfobacterota bacterium]|nr:DUF5329 domain-containing protein [Thermodesulfobacteriota bacterium]
MDRVVFFKRGPEGPLSGGRTMGRTAVGFLVLLFLLSAGPEPAEAKDLSAEERQKIEALLLGVEALTDARFVRNGKDYPAAAAAEFLRRKWQSLEAKVSSAEDFIDRVASVSSTTGQPYLIRFRDGREVPTAEFLRARLLHLP